MPKQDEQASTLFPKPIELKLADILFLTMRKNLIMFKDLGRKRVHYSFFIYDSTIDCHETLEVDHKHIPILKVEFDWRLLLQNVVEEARCEWKSISQIVKIDDPEWQDLEVEFIPIQILSELLPSKTKKVRWNVDLYFLNKLEQSMNRAKLWQLDKQGIVIGTGSGYLVFSNGIDCLLFDTHRMSKIIEKNFERSIKKIHLQRYTLNLVLWYVKMRLMMLTHSVAKCMGKVEP